MSLEWGTRLVHKLQTNRVGARRFGNNQKSLKKVVKQSTPRSHKTLQ